MADAKFAAGDPEACARQRETEDIKLGVAQAKATLAGLPDPSMSSDDVEWSRQCDAKTAAEVKYAVLI